MSIDASLACFEHDGREINLIDTPGEPSFVADAIAALRVADAAVVVVNGVDGGRGPHRAALAARRRRGPGAARLRQHARPRAGRLLPRARLAQGAPSAPHVVATEIPIGAEHEVRGVVDLIDMKAFVYEGDGPRRAPSEVEIPEELRERRPRSTARS